MEKLGNIIGSILKRYEKRLEKERVKILWSKVVGEEICRRTIPLDVEEGCLEVAVSDGMWAKELQLREEKFLDLLKEYNIRRIKFIPMPRRFLRGKR
ncbi:MAG: DUF721 domain-containing protein [Clostridia bacterium]|nr:DUF721 domain-containing protein [Synergistota bacterium]MBC7336539.1 DUF721 domain-containing protein [Clostridia bacterium]